MALPLLALLALLPAAALAQTCPFNFGAPDLPGRGLGQYPGFNLTATQQIPYYGFIKGDLRALFVSNKPQWPADAPGYTYAPLFIRLAWHCAGSYRTSDGRGGCNGGRIRFEPERSWPDNTNLDKALQLLWPIKDKWGNGLSWSDLIVLAGDTAIEAMGGPILGFCAGRIDDTDGTDSLELGPSREQAAVAPCPDPGNCQGPLGPTTIGLIYVNPEGPKGVPNPALSAGQIRAVFRRMGMNNSETVALIGGGHAFGKTHGACRTGPGQPPVVNPANPWAGTCGTGPLKGKGPNTYTSGFEGPWTTTPTKWSNQYFKNLLEYKWDRIRGPGGKWQWKPTAHTDPNDKSPLPRIMMLTADIALLRDPIYLALVKRYATSLPTLENDFKHAWYKLMTRDMGPVTRCVGGHIPPAQPFQMPLPPAPPANQLPNWQLVRNDLYGVFYPPSAAGLTVVPDLIGATPWFGAQYIQLAWQCASTFRETNFHGGCNGARIRFKPQRDWPENAGLYQLILRLKPIKDKYGPGLTWADLIVYAGNMGLELGSGGAFPFCPGRADAYDAEGVDSTRPRMFYATPIIEVRDRFKQMGLTARQWVALQARTRSPQHMIRLGYSGSWTWRADWVNYAFYKVLLNDTWVPEVSPWGKVQYRSTLSTPTRWMTPQDMAIRWDPEMKAIAQEYCRDHDRHLKDLISAWTRIMNSDRFAGPGTSPCPVYIET